MRGFNRVSKDWTISWAVSQKRYWKANCYKTSG